MRDLIRHEFLEESPKIGARSVSSLPASAVNAQPQEKNDAGDRRSFKHDH